MKLTLAQITQRIIVSQSTMQTLEKRLRNLEGGGGGGGGAQRS